MLAYRIGFFVLDELRSKVVCPSNPDTFRNVFKGKAVLKGAGK